MKRRPRPLRLQSTHRECLAVSTRLDVQHPRLPPPQRLRHLDLRSHHGLVPPSGRPYRGHLHLRAARVRHDVRRRRWYTEERGSAGSSSRPRRPPPPGRLPTRLSCSRSPDGPTAAGSERPSRRHSLRVPRGAGECLPAGVSAVQYEVGAGRVLRSFQEVHTDRTGSHRPNSSGTGGEVHSWVHIPRLIPLAHTTLH